MKILNKYFITILFTFFSCAQFQSYAGINENQAEKLGNFLDNAFTHMSEDEKEMFMQEVQREQEKLMNMTPEERAAKEEEVSRQLDALMSDESPYHDMFQGPARPPVETKTEEKEEKAPTRPTKKPAPKKTTIGKSAKNQAKELAQKIVRAADSIFVKTDSMRAIDHKSWNEGRWSRLKTNLQELKSQLLMAVNSDKILTEFVNIERKGFKNDLEAFEKTITSQASQLKTPDSMGLVVVFEGKPKVIDQKRYETAVLKLKNIVDTLSNKLAQHDLVSRTKGLVKKHAPQTKKTVISLPDKPVTKKVIRTSQQDLTCLSDKDKKAAIKEIEATAVEVKRCANQQLLDLSKEYKKTTSTSLRRKLQWKLSELELHLDKITKNVKIVGPKCTGDIAKTLDGLTTNKNLIELSKALKSINGNSGINLLTKQIKSHLDTINLK